MNNRFDYRMDPIPAVGEHTAAILRELGYAEGMLPGGNTARDEDAQ